LLNLNTLKIRKKKTLTLTFGEEQVKDNGIGKITPPQGSNIDDLASRMGLSESDLK